MLAASATSDVSNLGTTVFAYAEGSTIDSSVNGVTFTANTSRPSKSAGKLNGATTGDTNFDELLDKIPYGGGASTSIDLGALTSGQDYQI